MTDPTREDPWRLAEWNALPDRCGIAGCGNNEADQRGPVFMRDGTMHKVCPEHWEPIMRVMGERATWSRDAMTVSTESGLSSINLHVTDQLPAGVAAIAISPPSGPDDDRPITARAVIIRDGGDE